MTDRRVFRLFANCVPVQGARRSTICDLQRGTYKLIPNGLYEILTEHRDKTLAEIKDVYDHEFDLEIDEYFQFLETAELGFWCDEPERFPELDLSWQAPQRITNAIVDIDDSSQHDYRDIVRQLDDLGCTALQLRFFSSLPLSEVERVLEQTDGSRLRSIDLFVPFTPETSLTTLTGLCKRFQRISNIFVHSAPEVSKEKVDGLGSYVFFRQDVVDSPSCCGQIHPGYFVANLQTFTEARQHNSCLNRKISIDARGEIKNCPSMEKSFGKVGEVSLAEALAHRDFKKLWQINKDQIKICQDCEFRYICTDCRAYVTDAEDLYSKPSKCSYDPYTATWG